MLETLLTTAGLTPTPRRVVPAPWEYPDEETMLDGLMSIGPAAAAIVNIAEHQRDRYLPQAPSGDVISRPVTTVQVTAAVEHPVLLIIVPGCRVCRLVGSGNWPARVTGKVGLDPCPVPLAADAQATDGCRGVTAKHGRRQVRRLLLGEALVLGLLGSAAGVVMGLPVMRFEAWMLNRLGFVPPGFSVEWQSWVIAVAAGTGVGIAVLGVLGASRRASRVRPLEALRETGKAARVMTWSRWVYGLFFLAGGTALVSLAPAAGGDAALALSLLVCIVLVMAFSALSPLVVPLVGRLLGLLVRLLGRRALLGELAHANLRDGVRRSAATAAPILVLVGLVAGIAGTLGAVTAGSREEALRTLNGDLIVTADRPIATELTAVDGVRTVSEETPVTFRVEERAPGEEPELAAAEGLAIDPATYQLTHHLPLEAGSLDALRGQTVAVNSGYAPEQDWRVGGTLHVRIDDTPRDLRIVAVIPLRVAGPDFLLPDGVVPAGVVDRRYVIQVGNEADPAAVAGQIDAAELGSVSTVGDWIRDDVGQQQQDSLKVMLALLGMATLYTLIAMVNAVVIAASDRTAEFAAARLTGLTRGQVVRAALWESLAVIVVGVLLGGLAAAGTVTGVSAAVSDIVGTSVISGPWLLFGGLAAGAAVVVGAASVLTTLAATRQPAVTLAGTRE